MKINSKLIGLSLCAALLLSGCNNDANNAPTVTDNGDITTTAASQTEPVTTVSEAAQTTTTTRVAAIAGEEDSMSSMTVKSEQNTDIMQYTMNQLEGKQITCENRDSLNLEYSDWFLKKGEVPKKGEYSEDVTLEFTPTDYRFMGKARYSSGAMSKSCDDAFRSAVASTSDARFYEYMGDVFRQKDTVMVVDSVTDTLNMSKIEYGYKTDVYDRMFVVNAFVRRAEEKESDNKNIVQEYYEFIIDPAYMQYLGMPMTEYDPERMKFNVNGTEFYADTIRGYAAPITYLIGGSSVSKFQGKDFIYAKITLMNPEFNYSNTEGALAKANLMTVEPLTEDTDSVINGTYVTEAMLYSNLAEAIKSAEKEIVGDTTVSFDLIDLDFDGTPEVITQYSNDVSQLDGPYASINCRVYGYKQDKMELLGEFEKVEGNPIYEVKYLPTGEHGWHFTDFKDHCFMTLKNGKLDIQHLTEQRPVGEKNEYGYYENYDYYYLGEKIVIEPYEDYNPLTGQTNTYYKWTSKNSLGYSVMSDNPYKVYDMLYENLNSDFHNLNTYDFRNKLVYADNNAFETNKLSNTFTPSANFPVDVLSVYQDNKVTAELYQNYYGISFEGAKEKPVIYLYPEEQTDVSVQVNFPYGGELTCTYPEYDNGWNVTALPDGTLYDENGDEYYCLYWEGQSVDVMNDSEGFCVAGKDTAKFLREKLMYIGLSAREANEFIIYWLPRMQDNPYNIITLHTADYAASVPLSVSPAPDTQIRVFMTYTASDEYVDIPAQELPHYERNGFTLVEWGGTEK